jgi:environmental stress-induced protein Ves
MDILHVDRLPLEPWKNRGGTTRAIAAAPPGAGFDTVDWRVDLTEITRPGAFSHLPGIDRVLLPLASGLSLGHDGAEPMPVEIFGAVAFDGAAPTQCALSAEASRGVPVLNLLLRRGRHAGDLRVFAGSGRLRQPGGAVVLYAARGGFNLVLDGERPVPLDAGRAAVNRDGERSLAFEPYRPWSLLIAAMIRPAAQT